MQFSIEMSFEETKVKLLNVLKAYNGMTKEGVINQSKYSRNILTDFVFALKDIAELVGIIELQSLTATNDICDKLMGKFNNMISETMPDVIKSVIKSQHEERDHSSGKDQEKFSILVEKGNDETFSKESWSDIAKHNINDKLKHVPVQKTLVTREGQGCIVLPSKKAQDQAELALKDDFTIVKSVKSQSKILPKLMIYDIDEFGRDDASLLKEAIADKSESIRALINDGKTLDVIYIDERRRHAVLKVSPEIRNVIMKYGTVFVGMQSHRAKDHVHVIQCYACQKYGHKQGSQHCQIRVGHHHCLYCSGDHRSKDCPVKADKSKYKCLNCANSKNKQYQENSCHTSTSNSCPFVIKEKEATLRRTAFVQAKNV